MSRRSWRWVLGGVIALALVIQVIPGPEAGNPPVETEVNAPQAVLQVLRQSCYDCHSNETAWPWYARVAPAKWLVRRHVSEARSELNFSAWNRYDADEAAHKWEEVAEEVEEEHMPLRSYLIIHRDARLSDEDRATLLEFAGRQGEGPGEARSDATAAPAEPLAGSPPG